MGSMDFRAEHRQQQTLSPKLQHAVRLLTLSSMDFAQVVQQASGKNPFLEIEDDDGDGPGAATEGASPGESDAETNGHTSDADLSTDSDREVWQSESYASRHADGDEPSALERMPLEASLASHLHTQLALQPLGKRMLLLAKVIVESLDDDGYLRTPFEELMAIDGLAPRPTAVEMEQALQIVQALEPAGVGARNVGECLRLQLPAIEDRELRALAGTIIDSHLKQLAARDVAALSRLLDRSPADIEKVCDRIRHLDPRPGWRVGSSQMQYVIPDVIVRKVRGAWTVRLNSAIVPKVKLNREVTDLFQRCRHEGNAAMADHLQEARWTLRNVEQRFSTIVDVAEAIVRRQKHFLDFGPMAMKPLALRDIADEIGVHESTVSRVTNNKYMATPSGVFELKYFFSRAMLTASGNACSGTAIRGLIKDMIEIERPSEPLSDAEIARQLARQGLKVARRTVTKYRQALRIEAVDRRRRHS